MATADRTCALALTAVALLFVLALAEAWLIVVYFMHIGQLRQEAH